MKAKPLVDAIRTMRDMESVDYTTSPDVWAGKLNRLAWARIELEIELGGLDVEVEPQTVKHGELQGEER